MKKIIYVFTSLLLILNLTACSSSVKIKEVDSKIFSQEEIHDAIDTIITEMKKNWDGCTLEEIYYIGDDSLDSYRDLVSQYEEDKVMVLASSFEVDESGGDGSLESNSSYFWIWILVKDDNGKWQLIDHGSY